ncbi:GNAT family N-acetyltransferase [Plantibacter sp. LMC-P-059a]|jgi:ribosomal protein S18 acetylase RimI-like enzyme|uniref:GNAT family N-acetyltransferase n=1 Tax=Plantibacter sp. LMC-P-059a TaxID=3040297 RepID=UPI002551C4E2|nr:GNAT family N-acetyltransferase [Plantibacter sp. LMC-P-059a]
MRLQPTSEDDFDALRRLFDDPSFHGWGGPGRLSDELIRAKYLGARLPAVECFLVLLDDDAVGLVQLHTDGAEGAGIDLILSPSARGQGTGRRVVEAMLSRARARNIARLTVDPEVRNERGVRFWRAVGFEPYATVTDDAGRPPYVLLSRSTEAAAIGCCSSVTQSD